MKETEKPTDREVRQKLATLGIESLSDDELLSIIIREGSNGSSALDLARRLLEAHNNSLTSLSKAGLPRLRMTEGIGMARASALAACFELNSRIKREETSPPGVIINKEDVVAIFSPMLSHLSYEEMWALYLTSANGVIEKCKISQGGVQTLIVDSRLVIKRALELLASSVILVHNHPSGVSVPSEEDIKLTQRIADAASLFDIMLIDHIIVSEANSYSFRHHGLIT